ncbi:MAG: 30S ribosome-binding factor RbfA [candidate division Zixibacteria bacterium]|jgi:ribosome-binding factor A|nr:30S ribosome-binding factor RbfA [candidate division Zixibacteria bacterium]
MKSFSRIDRLASQIKRTLSKLIINDPELPEGMIISITDVELTKDLRYGKVFYSVLGDDVMRDKASLYFEHQTKYLRMETASQIRVKFIPELKYLYDNSIERGQRINQLLDQIKHDRQQGTDQYSE